MIIAFVVLDEKMWPIILLLQKRSVNKMLYLSICKKKYINLGLIYLLCGFHVNLACVCPNEANLASE